MIYIVRHGETDWNVEGRYAGQIDVLLNETGVMQAKKIYEELKDVEFDKIFSSPLNRAYKTAQIITNSDNIIIDNRLIERYNGELQGKLKIECSQMLDFNDPNIGYNIEGILDFRKRIFSFLHDITINHVNENILIVTHAGVAIYIRCYFEGEPMDGDYSKYKLKNCEILKYKNDIINR